MAIHITALVAPTQTTARTRLDAVLALPGLVPEPYPQRERYQQHVGHGRDDHDPVDGAHGCSVALNARSVVAPRSQRELVRVPEPILMRGISAVDATDGLAAPHGAP
jgi:hypothetical protein